VLRDDLSFDGQAAIQCIETGCAAKSQRAVRPLADPPFYFDLGSVVETETS
jgi:hypothetical protein